MLLSRLDGWIPFQEKWVWIYSGAYYGILGLPLAYLRTDRECVTFIASGVGLFLLSTLVHILFPTRCPAEWRQYSVDGLSTRFLASVQYYDTGLSCFPSLHCAFAAYAAVTLPFGLLTLLLPLIISASCMFVKQHSIVEIPGSLIIGGIWGLAVRAVLR